MINSLLHETSPLQTFNLILLMASSGAVTYAIIEIIRAIRIEHYACRIDWDNLAIILLCCGLFIPIGVFTNDKRSFLLLVPLLIIPLKLIIERTLNAN